MQREPDDQTFWDDIEGYCGKLSYVWGETVELHVSTRSATFDVVVERWGSDRTEVWRSDSLEGTFLEPPTGADSNGCGWPVSVRIPVEADWRSGFYLVTLVAHGADPGSELGHAGFVVRAAPANRSNTVLVLGTNTWNAYNTWGGMSLYTGGSQVSFRRPFGRGMLCRPEVERRDRKARPVRFRETPDAGGHIFQDYRTANAYPSAIGSAGWFTHERRFVEWAESEGFEFDMAVSSDLDIVPGVLDGYELVVGVGHDEYWSVGGRDVIDRYLAGGGNVASFSGNTMFWQVRFTAEADHMICHKYSAHVEDPVMSAGEPERMTGMWADPLIGRPEWATLGAGSAFGLYHRFGDAAPRGVGGFEIVDPDHWMLIGTGCRYGDVVGRDDGVVGYETLGCPLQFDDENRLVAREFPAMPDNMEIVGFTLSSNLAIGEYPASVAALSDQGDLEFVSARLSGEVTAENMARWRRGNAVMLTCRPAGPAGGQMVTVGTTDWVFGLAHDPQVGRITANVLDRLVSNR
ncbi:MAG: hypothetical protein GY708_14060 [Actinomycetia bacterium]|nr:hypothetical protein [Actinomycetes bacterium]